MISTGKKFFEMHDRNIDPETIREYLYNDEWETVRRIIHNHNKNRKIKAHIRINKLGLKLAYMIKRDIDYKVFPAVERLYPGHWQRSAGAWLWVMYFFVGTTTGSSYPATTVIKWDKLCLVGEDINEG